jgi:hypothetical protein
MRSVQFLVAFSDLADRDIKSHITFELYERNYGRGKSDKEYSIRLSISEGAHSSNVLDSTVDARHSLNVQPRRYVTINLIPFIMANSLEQKTHATFAI